MLMVLLVTLLLRLSLADPLDGLGFRSPLSGLDNYIIQIAPDITIGHFLSVYPSLAYSVRGQVNIGSFQAIYGQFERRLARYLAYSTLVVDITRDIDVNIFDVQFPAPRHLARLSQPHSLGQPPFDYVYDHSAGEGVDVYIFDTGIGEDMEEFGDRVMDGRDFTGEGHGDHNGHGTCVAGVIGSKSFGVAKLANLVEVKVVSSDGKGKLSWVLSGIDWTIRSQSRTGRPSVINMSLGTPKNTMFNKAVQQAVEMDVPVIAAAGNSDTSACRISPASADTALTIGAFDDRTDTVASFSNWGQCVDAFAPGVNVMSVRLREEHESQPWVLYSGTSVAAPVGAGLVAYYMGMGDTGSKSIQRVKDLRVQGQLSRTTLVFKPLTENYILYNEAGEPLW
ncbi:alkaline extracellular protease [Trichomonascus vanleenenianus]|uniref:S8 family peptidase n=1 Tax=Trichomonascus vanleenenianus TaxID=2268995 RepID=UPI003ECBAA4C